MNNELENKLKSLTDLAKNFGFGKEEAVKLAKNLISEYTKNRKRPQPKNRNPQRNLGA